MRLGLFNKPLKREKEYDQILTTNTNGDNTDDGDEVVFAGSIRGGGNLEAYLSEIGRDSASVADTEITDTDDVKINIEEAVTSISTENNSGTEDNVESEENTEDIINRIENTSDGENDNQDFEENEGSTEVENDSTNEENFNEINEETEHSDDFDTDTNELNNVSDKNDDSDEELCDKVNESSDSANTEANEDISNAAEISNDSSAETEEHIEDDYILDLEDTDVKIDEAKINDSIHNEEHKDLVYNEISMKEKFISLDIADKKEYIQRLFAEFDELSEYLIEYREKIDQKVADMQQMIKSLYIQISTCDLEDARGIVEKIQKYSKHNKSLDELKDYIDSIMTN